MKRKTSYFDLSDSEEKLYKVHHLVEATEDSLIETIQSFGLMDMIDEENLSIDYDRMDTLPAQHQALLASFTSINCVHDAIHDVMRHNSFEKIEDGGFRQMVKEHVPRNVKHGNMKRPQIDESNKLLERND